MSLNRAYRQDNNYSLSNNTENVYVAPIRSLQAVQSKKQFRLNATQKMCYCLAILALVIGLVQFSRCCFENLSKVQALMVQSQLVTENLQQAKNEQNFLKDQIHLYHSPLGAETIARERLNFVKDDEVLIQVFPVKSNNNNKVASAQ